MPQDISSAKTNGSGLTFEPELLTKLWQHNAMRMMRANECLLQGLLTATTREMELARDMFRSNFERMQTFATRRPEALTHGEAEHNISSAEHFLSSFRGIMEDLWKSFGEASKLMMEGSLEEGTELVGETIKKSARQAEMMTKHAETATKRVIEAQPAKEAP